MLYGVHRFHGNIDDADVILCCCPVPSNPANHLAGNLMYLKIFLPYLAMRCAQSVEVTDPSGQGEGRGRGRGQKGELEKSGYNDIDVFHVFPTV